MSILDVTEDQIFHTLGKGRDPNFKQIEKIRPTITPAPKKTYIAPVKKQIITNSIQKPVAVEQTKYVTSPEVEESINTLTTELLDLKKSVTGIQSMIKLYLSVFALALVIFVGLMGLFIIYT
ncbi:MAG: hypothetical protein Q7J35_05865 [Candidatus Methanoperedens sp.]|nr:hypothetical protein [Candidatus Methanoperedens sp.]